MSDLAKQMLEALRTLHKERMPHACGGFSADDMTWQIRRPFTDEGRAMAAIDELLEAGLVKWVGLDISDDANCYTLTAEGGLP